MSNVAVPELRAGVAMGLPATMKVTVPVAEAGLTVAVKVTLSPSAEGLADDTIVMVVAARFTVCVTVLLVLVP